MGQKVLSIKVTTAGLAVTAGIHYSKPGEAPVPVAVCKGENLRPEQLAAIKTGVGEGIQRGLWDRPRSIGRTSTGCKP
jgi:hypothetical protein